MNSQWNSFGKELAVVSTLECRSAVCTTWRCCDPIWQGENKVKRVDTETVEALRVHAKTHPEDSYAQMAATFGISDDRAINRRNFEFA